MSRPPHQPASLLKSPFRGSVAVRQRLLTPDQLRTRAWRRLFRDVYVHRDIPVTHELRVVAAASLVVPGSVVSGRSAAVLWGIDMADAGDDVELTVPPGRPAVRAAGLRVRRAIIDQADVWDRHGVRTTGPAVTALRLAAVLPADEAVVLVDRMVSAGRIDLEKLRQRASQARGPGSAKARTACAMADGLAQSPQETRLRLLLARSPLPAPVAQFAVYMGGASWPAWISRGRT